MGKSWRAIIVFLVLLISVYISGCDKTPEYGSLGFDGRTDLGIMFRVEVAAKKVPDEIADKYYLDTMACVGGSFDPRKVLMIYREEFERRGRIYMPSMTRDVAVIIIRSKHISSSQFTAMSHEFVHLFGDSIGLSRKDNGDHRSGYFETCGDELWSLPT